MGTSQSKCVEGKTANDEKRDEIDATRSMLRSQTRSTSKKDGVGEDGDGPRVRSVAQDCEEAKAGEEEKEAEPARIKIDFSAGDVVKIKDGPFESFEGEIDEIDEASGKISVLIEIFGRHTPAELEYWQVEKV